MSTWSEDTDDKAQVRSWLYKLLAELEIMTGVEGKKVELAGNKVTIELQFKV